MSSAVMWQRHSMEELPVKNTIQNERLRSIRDWSVNWRAGNNFQLGRADRATMPRMEKLIVFLVVSWFKVVVHPFPTPTVFAYVLS